MIGVAQATEAIKLLLGQGEPLVGRLLTYDSLKMTFRTLKLRRDPKCPAWREPHHHELHRLRGILRGSLVVGSASSAPLE